MSLYLEPYRLDDGTVMIPKRADSEDGTVTGVGFGVLQSDDPQYAEWLVYLEAIETDGTSWDERASQQLSP